MNEILFQTDHYKDVVKELIAHKRKEDSALTNKVLASKIPIQSTYLSKFFNDESSHLKDETLFRLGKVLGLSNKESDYLLLLKNYLNSEDPERKSYLFQKIQDLKTSLKAPVIGLSKQLELESMYLLNPKCMIVQMALNIQSYAQNPRLLCAPLNLSVAQLIEILDLIENNGFIIRGEGPLEITKVNLPQFHIESHELMRLHQYLFKTLIPPKLQETKEEDKKSFLVTFNLDEKCYKEAITRFDQFIGEVKDITKKSRNEGVYQISFDFFKWC